MTERAERRLVIAVDGPAASGKGTLARRLADAFGLPYLDTGLLYRAVARLLLEAGRDGEAEAVRVAAAMDASALARGDLRTPEIDRAASRVAAWPALRTALLDTQRRFVAASGGVLDGRDIGTVVCPGADAKLFVTASAEERARRRLRQRGEADAPDAVAREAEALRTRDAADAGRAAAPLVAASDAMALDTTALDPDEAYARARALIDARLRDRLA